MVQGRCKYCGLPTRRACIRVRDFDVIETCGRELCSDRAFREHFPDSVASTAPPPVQ
jgi:hypothetical protein